MDININEPRGYTGWPKRHVRSIFPVNASFKGRMKLGFVYFAKRAIYSHNLNGNSFLGAWSSHSVKWKKKKIKGKQKS